MAIDLDAAQQEFAQLKTRNTERNNEYYLLRQAVQGNFRWPANWPNHIPKRRFNLCKPITERFVTYLMGKGFSYNVDRPNSLEFREAAERAEKILARLLHLSKSKVQFDLGAKSGSQLGRTVFKVYKTGQPGGEYAAFTHCQPDYFYAISAGDSALNDWAVVYYSYPIDITTARATYGKDRDYKTEAELSRANYYDPLPEASRDIQARDRKVPVLEIWTKEDYALLVGGVTIFNGKNPFAWSDTGEGIIPFVVIENVRNQGEAKGEADIAQSRELNEELNWLMSQKLHLTKRYLMPTLVWEGAPQNYSELVANTQAGGGALPTRLGSKLYFLAYDKPNPMVTETLAELRAAILEVSGMTELALQGQVNQSVATGISVATMFQPVLSTVAKKQVEWSDGLSLLFAMLLNIQESIGDSKVLGKVVINETLKSRDASDGEVVALSGKDIKGLRKVTIAWPGVLPKDDMDSSRLEMEKASQGLQSIYTTLEKLGEEYPDDEIARIQMENANPLLRGQQVAEQMRAATPLMKAQMEMQQGGGSPPTAPAMPPEEQEEMDDEELAAQGDIGARLRMLQRAQPEADTEGEDMMIRSGVGV